MTTPAEPTGIAVVVPARNEAGRIGSLVIGVLAQAHDLGVKADIVVVDDGSSDATADVARSAGARVVSREGADGGNPGAARNLGAAHSIGDPLVFLDADCMPAPGWLGALLAAHDAGHAVVGGALDLPPGLPWTARADYYGGWYHVHSRRTAGPVPSHPPGNLSVRRAVFDSGGGFTERHPVAYAHEELAWQGAVRREGHVIHFTPEAIVWHHNRSGLGQLLRRNYRWGYSAVEAKAPSGATRLGWFARHPWLRIALAVPMAPVEAAYVAGCWVRVGTLEPLAQLPVLLAARSAYQAGLIAGAVQWLRTRGGASPRRPRWE